MMEAVNTSQNRSVSTGLHGGTSQLKGLVTVFLSWAAQIQSKFSHPASIRFFLILPVLQSRPRSSEWSLPLSLSNQYFVFISHFPHACYMHRLFHHLWFDHPTLFVKIVHYALSSCIQIFSLSPSAHISNLCSSLNVRNQVSHPYKSIGKIIVSFILILVFYIATWKTKQSDLHDK